MTLSTGLTVFATKLSSGLNGASAPDATILWPTTHTELATMMGLATAPTAFWNMGGTASTFTDTAGGKNLVLWGTDSSVRDSTSAALNDNKTVSIPADNWWNGGYRAGLNDLEVTSAQSVVLMIVLEKIDAVPTGTPRNSIGSSAYELRQAGNTVWWQTSTAGGQNAQSVAMAAAANKAHTLIGVLNRATNSFKLITSEGNSAGQAITGTLGTHTTAIGIGKAIANGRRCKIGFAAVWIGAGAEQDFEAGETAFSAIVGW